MRVALAQINTVVGDFENNSQKILDYIGRARDKRADVVVFSELALFGYPPLDFVEDPSVVQRQNIFLKKIISKMPKGITAIVGAVSVNPKKVGKSYFNSAVILERGKAPAFVHKTLLPSYDIFDENRYFEPGDGGKIINIRSLGKVGISVCEDLWFDFKRFGRSLYHKDPMAHFKGKCDLIINLSASPFSIPKPQRRLKVIKDRAKKLRAPVVYVNQVGGQDEILFDGRSVIVDEKGKVICKASAWHEDLLIADLKSMRSEFRPHEIAAAEDLRLALTTGIRDFANKTGFKKLHLGISGGVDSALVACLAADALGPSRVTGLILPGPFSTEHSKSDAKELAKNLHISVKEISINKIYQQCIGELKGSSSHAGNTPTLADQNLQARLRGLILMYFANENDSLLLTTGNKSEIATGYCTLYGDMCGGLNPIGDLTKHQVYMLAKHYNEQQVLIPPNILEKAPSAELAPGQKDQDSLPPYEKLDEAVVHQIENPTETKDETENWLRKMLHRSEFKRKQAAPILRISDRSFGLGRRYPIAKST